MTRWWRSISMQMAAVALSSAAACVAQAADVVVLSAGAVEPGLKPALAAFEAQTGHRVTLSFATAPQIRDRVAADPALADVVIAPTAVVDELLRGGKLPAFAAGERSALGKVGIGVAVRPDAPRPDISTPDALRAALLAADSVVYNRASTGVYVEALIARWGLADTLRDRTTRYPDGASVMQHVLHGRGREIGMGAMTEAALLKSEGLVLLGPLPAEIQNTTTYESVITTRGRQNAAAAALLAHLNSAAMRERFKQAGID